MASGKKKLVVLTGAGISADSGLRTFRDGDGLWEGYDVTEVATPRAFNKNPQLVLDFYNMRRRDVAMAKPNAAHYALAALQEDFEVHIITQNIDDLHERAGSASVLHLHGEIFKMHSVADPYTWYDIRTDINPGDLAPDGRQLRPAIVWFEEPVPKMEEAVPLVHDADIFVIIGTSLVVYPAAGLVHYVRSSVPVFLLDKKIPVMQSGIRFRSIEQPAAAGAAELTMLLKQLC